MNRIFAILYSRFRKDYGSNDNINSTHIPLATYCSLATSLLRGIILRYRFAKGSKIPLIGKSFRCDFPSKILFGSGCFIGDNVRIMGKIIGKIEIGNNVSIHDDAVIDLSDIRHANCADTIYIGNNVGINRSFYGLIRGPLIVEDDVIFGPNVTLITESHNFDNPNVPIRLQGVNRKGIQIRSGSWIGANVTLIDGIQIGCNTIVGAGSVLTKSAFSYSIYAGVPARLIRKRNE